MANSVLDELDIQDEVSEIFLFISGYRSVGKVTVLVEGIDDVMVYEKFFAKDKVQMHHSSGCYKLVELLEKLNEKHLGELFIGIKDADYDVLNHVSYPYPNLFLTDKHDLETMMISGGVLEEVVKYFLRYEDMRKAGKHPDVDSLLQEALAKLRPLSYVRWYNSVSDCKLNFGKLCLSTMLREDASLGYDCCLTFLGRLNTALSRVPTSAQMETFEKDHSEEIDCYHLVRGHDLCEMISLLLMNHSYYHKRSKVSADKVHNCLGLAYSKDEFRRTRLYASINSWFEKHAYSDMMAC